MKTMFLMGAALAAAIATPASAQLLGGGGLTGGLGGSLSGGIGGNLGGNIDRTVATIRDTAGATRDRVRSGVATARDRAVGAVGNARDRASGAVGRVRDGAGSLTGAASGSASGMANGAIGNGSASGSGSGEGSLSLIGSGTIPALNPGQTVRDAKGEAIGRVQSVRRCATGRVESMTMAVGKRVATIPADNFSVEGGVLVSAMGEGQVKRAAKDQAE